MYSNKNCGETILTFLTLFVNVNVLFERKYFEKRNINNINQSKIWKTLSKDLDEGKGISELKTLLIKV